MTDIGFLYADHHATTPVAPEVLDSMAPWMVFSANASSVHSFGRAARQAVEEARADVARAIGASPEEIVFTSGGTEADNLAVRGGALAAREEDPRRTRVAVTKTEHPAVREAARSLVPWGFRAEELSVDADGLPLPEEAEAALGAETALLSAILASNETGVVNGGVPALAGKARRAGALSHTDAVQAVGKIPVDVRALGVDLLSFSGHKIHGPQGTGALYVRKGVALSPRAFGGHQERGVRPGTENVAAIAGFGKSCELAAKRLEADAAYLAALRSEFEAAVLRRVPGAAVNGEGAPRLPNTANIAFEGLEGEILAFNLDLLGVAVSTVAACSSADREPSHVLIAMGRTPAQARSSVRFSFGRGNSREDMLRAVDLVVQAVESMGGLR